MKSVFWCLVIFFAIMLASQTDLFDIFASKGALAWAVALVFAVLLIGFKVLGSPLGTRGAKDEKDEDA